MGFFFLNPCSFQAYENNEEMKLKARGEAGQEPRTLAGDKVLPLIGLLAQN